MNQSKQVCDRGLPAKVVSPMLMNCSIVRDALFLPVQVMSRGPLPWLMDTHRAIFPSSKAQAFMVMLFIAVV